MALAGATPAMMYRLVVLDDEAQSQEAFFGGGGGLAPPPPTGFNPVVLHPIGPPSPPSSGSAGAGEVQAFRRVCSVANLTVCAPPGSCFSLRCVFHPLLLLLLLLLLHHSSAAFALLSSCHAELRVFMQCNSVSDGFLLNILIAGRELDYLNCPSNCSQLPPKTVGQIACYSPQVAR